MARSRSPQEVDPTTFGTCVLVPQKRQYPAAFHDFLDRGGASFFGQNKLPVVPAKPVDELIEIWIVHLPCDGIGRHAKQASDVTTHFEIAKMARDGNQRPVIDQVVRHLDFVPDVNILSPIGVVDFSRCLGNLATHQTQVIPHLPRHLTAIRLGHIRKYTENIFVDHLFSKLDHVGDQPSDPTAKLRTGIDGQDLNDAQDELENKIFDELPQNAVLCI